MFRSPLDILAGAVGVLAGLVLLFHSLFSTSTHSGILRDYPGFGVFLALFMIAGGVLGALRSWKNYFVDSRLPSPPKLFKDDPADRKQR